MIPERTRDKRTAEELVAECVFPGAVPPVVISSQIEHASHDIEAEFWNVSPVTS